MSLFNKNVVVVIADKNTRYITSKILGGLDVMERDLFKIHTIEKMSNCYVEPWRVNARLLNEREFINALAG